MVGGPVSLDSSENDTSIVLDLVRAVAAQLVCVGHAINFAGLGSTFIPNDGVLLFFVLSGFLIAYTLDRKSSDPDYTIVDFGIERTARIYTAYFPALLLIGVVTIVAAAHGFELKGDPTDLRTFVGNLTMRQNLPNDWGVSTFGTAGHLTSLAVEFHIYFFVGALYFLLAGRNVVLCAVIAFVFSTMPLAYFSSMPNSDRTLFILWLLGFAAYFTAKPARLAKVGSGFWLAAFAFFCVTWLVQRTPGDDYNLGQYPMLVLSFFSLVMMTQSSKVITSRLAAIVTFAADYSFSLFLLHLTTIRLVYALLGSTTLASAVLAIVLSNLLAIAFAMAFEQHYRQVASVAKKAVKRGAASLRSCMALRLRC